MLQQVEVGSILASRYELQALLGRGGMGLVFKALDRTLRGELVALKVLLPGVDLSAEVLARFRDEVKLARKVRHKNVCAIFEYQEDGDYPFIVMELVEGTDLKRALRKVHSLEWEEGFEVAIQVSEGLSAIHEAKIVHRDLKPANITRDKRDVVRVMDFGIALSDTHADFTEMGKVVGTIDYMSPEQFRGVSLDQRSDIYSFGIVIYELFTGRVPFRGDVATIVQKHLKEPPPLHGVAADQIPPSLVPVLERALSKNRNDRFSSATEMSKALQAARDKMRRDGTDPVSGSGGRLGLTPPRPRPVAPYPSQARLLVPALIRALGSPDRGVRLGAADALAHTPDRLARPALEKAREDPDLEVRGQAMLALRELDELPAEPPAEPIRAEPAPAEPPPADEELPATSDIDIEVRPTPAPEGLEPPLPPPSASEPAPPPLPPSPAARFPRWVNWLVVLVIVVPLLVIGVSRLLDRPQVPERVPPTTTLEPIAIAPSTELPATTAPVPPPKAARVPVAPTSRPTPRAASPTTTLAPPKTTPTLPPTPAPTPEPVVATAPPTPAPTPPPTPPPTTEPPTPAPPPPGALVEGNDPALSRPRCVACPAPQLPLIAEDPRYRSELQKSGGYVELRVLVDENGRVVQATALKGDKALSDAAVKAVRLWRYTPGTKQDVKVKVWIVVPIQFVLPPLR